MVSTFQPGDSVCVTRGNHFIGTVLQDGALPGTVQVEWAERRVGIHWERDLWLASAKDQRLRAAYEASRA